EHTLEAPLRPDETLVTRRIQLSYSTAIGRHRKLHRAVAISWFTWIIVLITFAIWCLTAYQVALTADAHSLRDILANVFSNSQNADVLITYGAKYNQAILEGQYWRFFTPVFLHVNILHIGLNMLNLIVLGIFVERIFGHLRFLLIYLVTGVISIIASFYFAPQEISVGASGAIFGLVGAYSLFIFIHRKAFRRGGIPALSWLVLVIGINLGIGLIIPNVDNYAHVGGFLSGCILGWFFAPYYVPQLQEGKTVLIDTHSLISRWPLALLTIATTGLFAIIAVHFIGG
ncbi:MAG TPA: rhomboid family intramembrane serine protease, partial [Ktedonobacteraceae bacterium]|nr:rhomboid family intramembrane serine protease [Ktedonobacteraceae bacterium]